MNNAIKLAIEKGGYKASQQVVIRLRMNEDLDPKYVVLDPKFWQALGKALGWKKQKYCSVCMNKTEVWRQGWSEYALYYFQLVLTGGDTSKFWEGLLK